MQRVDVRRFIARRDYHVPTAASAQADAAHNRPVAQAEKPAPKQPTETKPFDPHAAHAPSAHCRTTKPWYDTSGPADAVLGG